MFRVKVSSEQAMTKVEIKIFFEDPTVKASLLQRDSIQ